MNQLEKNKSKIKMSIPQELRVNLHSHSAFSDGQYTPEALVIQAIERDVSTLGISDHYFTRKTPSIRPEMLNSYIDELDRIEEKFKGQIRLLKAIEINTLEFFLMDLDLPDLETLSRLDYVLLEYVANIPRAGIPIRHAILIAREVPVPCGLAHTDLPMAFPNLEPEELVEKLNSAGMFLELNEAYRRPGERQPFYEHYGPYLHAAKTAGLKFSVGTDAHHQMTGPASRAVKFLMREKLENSLFLGSR